MSSTSTEDVHASRHAEILPSCTHVATGERVQEKELTDEDGNLTGEGRLVQVATSRRSRSNAKQLIRY